MRCAHISFHSCIRALKIGWVQCAMGVEAHLVGSSFSPTHSHSPFASVHKFEGTTPDGRWEERQLTNTIKLLSPYVDLFHVHNEPNWMFRVVKQNTDKPVVFDIHDWTSIRNDPNQAQEVEEEKFALAEADAFIVPSKGYLKKIRSMTTKPSALVYSKVPHMFFPSVVRETKPGITFEGGIRGTNKLSLQYDYRNWAAWAKETVGHFTNGHKMYFYGADPNENFEEYKHDRIELQTLLVYPELINALSQHSAGLVGAPVQLPDFMDSVPNKLFEYASAGIPCLVLNSPEATAYVEDCGLGVGINSPADVPEALEKVKRLPVRTERFGHTMDGEIHKVLGIYNELCTSKHRVITQPEF